MNITFNGICKKSQQSVFLICQTLIQKLAGIKKEENKA